MRYNVTLTTELLIDLDKLANYLTKQFSEDTSNEVLARLFATFDSLQEFPQKGKAATELMFTFSGYMYLPLEKNVLFYKINEKRKEVQLLRMFSVNEDFMKKFDSFIN